MTKKERRDFSTYITDDKVLQGLKDFERYNFKSRNAYINHLLGAALDAYKVENWIFFDNELSEPIYKLKNFNSDDQIYTHDCGHDNKICFYRNGNFVINHDLTVTIQKSPLNSIDKLKAIQKLKTEYPQFWTQFDVVYAASKCRKVITLCGKFVNFQSNII
jgi:hypothetical protein